MGDLPAQPEAGAHPAEELQAKFEDLCRQVTDSPLNADLRARVGYAALDLGRRMEAIAAFVRALQLDPSLDFVRTRLRALCTPEELKTFRVPEEVAPFWSDIPGLLSWPLRGRGRWMLGLGSVYLAGALFVSAFGLVPWPQGAPITLLAGSIGAFAGGYLAAWLANLVRLAGTGVKEMPDWPDLLHPLDAAVHAFHWILAAVASFLPAIAAALLPGLDPKVHLTLVGMCAVTGVFLYPMAMLVTCLYGSGWSAFHYPFVVRSILRTMREYLFAWGVLGILVIVAALVACIGWLLGSVAPGADEEIAFLAYLLVNAPLLLYGYMVFCRLLGEVYFLSRSKLGWFEE